MEATMAKLQEQRPEAVKLLKYDPERELSSVVKDQIKQIAEALLNNPELLNDELLGILITGNNYEDLYTVNSSYDLYSKLNLLVANQHKRHTSVFDTVTAVPDEWDDTNVESIKRPVVKRTTRKKKVEASPDEEMKKLQQEVAELRARVEVLEQERVSKNGLLHTMEKLAKEN